MSWDIVLFNSTQNIKTPEEINPEQLVPTDFCALLEQHFTKIIKEGNHRRVVGSDFEIEYFADTETVSNKILMLYGEKGFFEILLLAKQNCWQIFDTGIGEMINLNNPEINGYRNFKEYLVKVQNDV